MTVYAIGQISIHDRARYDQYAAAFSATLTPYGGSLLAADEAPVAIEGALACQKVILLKFPDEAAFRAWARSPEYCEIAVDRHAATSGSVMLVRGFGSASA